MYQVFICYQRWDTQFARLLRAQLESVGLTPWLDKGELLPGDEWRENIDRAIKASSAMIVVISPSAKASEYVTYEWAFAWGAGVPVIPLVLRPVDVLHPRLESLQHVAFISEPYPWHELLTALDLVVHERGIRSVPIPRDAPPHVKQAVASLDASTAVERAGAVDTLRLSVDRTAIEALRHAVGHSLNDVRLRSAAALASRGVITASVARALREPWAPGASGYTEEDRDVCLRGAASLGPEAAQDLLTLYVDDESVRPQVRLLLTERRWSVEALAQQAFNAENSRAVRLAALEVIPHTWHAHVLLRPLVEDPDKDVSSAALQTILTIQDDLDRGIRPD